MNAITGLAALETENLGAIVRLAHNKMREEGKEIKLSEAEAEVALRQYYALPFLRPGQNRFAVSKTVDQYWHWHLLHTQDYAEFCQRVYGCMMHHVPLDPDNAPDVARVAQLYETSRAILVDHFGDRVSPRAYPKLSDDTLHDVVVCVMYDSRTDDSLH